MIFGVQDIRVKLRASSPGYEVRPFVTGKIWMGSFCPAEVYDLLRAGSLARTGL